ncbi:hypothetical protein [Streptomyces sp. NPDC060131]|uniref:hypothetical protein n=1 Tax=Streptomyces sp. NPDC060131 TaxID=3347058 RepID=UPI00364F35D2
MHRTDRQYGQALRCHFHPAEVRPQGLGVLACGALGEQVLDQQYGLVQPVEAVLQRAAPGADVLLGGEDDRGRVPQDVVQTHVECVP